MTERSNKLLRQYKRYLGSKDAESIIADTVALLQSGQSVPEDKTTILGNFPDFIEAVEKSYAEYEDRLKVSARNIEISSKELTTAFRDLENLNLNINAMLDSLGQGLLFFKKDGMCSPVFSQACLELLEVDPSDKFLPDVLGFSDDEKSNFGSWLKIVFSGNLAMDFDDLKDLLPEEIRTKKGAIISLDYKPMYVVEDQLTGVLLIATDITNEREYEEKLRHSETEVLKLQQIAQNRNGFYSFIMDMTDFLEQAEETDFKNLSEEEKDALMRILHTFKGYALSFKLDALAQKIHEYEVFIRREKIQDIDFSSLKEILEHKKELGRKLFGNAFMTGGKVKCVDLDTLETLNDMVVQSVENKDVRDKIVSFINRELLSIQIFQAFDPFQRELFSLAEQLGKQAPFYEIDGENLFIIPSDYEEFFNILIHLARNIMDHGIEQAAERVSKGKTEEGHVRISIRKPENEILEIIISDDGRGIDPSIIRQKLSEERGLDTSEESDDDVIHHIFDPSFTVKKEVSLISGQGIGMNAIRDVVEKLGGTIRVQSNYADSKGTSFIFTLPYAG